MHASAAGAPALLDAVTVISHLRGRGLLEPGTDASVFELGGGVSNVVLRVELPGGDVVVKQALERLRVSREWIADPARTVTEGRAMQLAAGVDRSWVPEVLDLDETARVLVVRAAPPATPDWKQRLLAGSVNPAAAAALGRFVATLHAATRFEGTPPPHLEVFDVDEAFAQLRIRPYFESVAARDAGVAAALAPVLAELRRRRLCLVHGDLSPKNVLIDEGLHWLIDWEVAHLGDPAFDVAFLCTHLVLKSVHRAADAVAFHRAALSFLDAYRSAGGPAPDDGHACALLGALLVARVDGDSPAEYLRPDEVVSVRALGRRLLSEPAPTLSAAIRGLAAS